jgi:hypothetical protein
MPLVDDVFRSVVLTDDSVNPGTGKVLKKLAGSADASGNFVQKFRQLDGDGNDVVSSSQGIAAVAVAVDGTVAVQVLAANPKRTGYTLALSDTSQTVYLGHTNAVTSANGLPLYPTVTLHRQGVGIYKGAIFARCATAESASVRVQEEANP